MLQAISVAFSLEANRQAGARVTVMDMMCDGAAYDPSRFSPDGYHPNDAGYAHMAARLAAIVQGTASAVPASCTAMRTVPTL